MLKKILLISLILFSSQSLWAEANLKRVEVLNVNYFQSEGNGHSGQISWLPQFFTMKDKWDFGARLGATFLPGEGEEKVWIASGDFLLGYQFNEKWGTEFSLGADLWEATDTFIELGVGGSYNTSATPLLHCFSDELYLGYSFIFNPDNDTHNVSLGFRKNF